MFSNCGVFRSRWSTTTRRAGAACRTVWMEKTAQISWSGEEEQEEAAVCPQCTSWCCLLCDSLCSVLMMPSGSLSVYFSMLQSCDEGTNRDRKNLRGRAAVSPAGEKTPFIISYTYKKRVHVCTVCLLLLIVLLWLNIAGLQGWDGQPCSVRASASDPAQQERHPLWKHAWDLQFSQQARDQWLTPHIDLFETEQQLCMLNKQKHIW